MRAGSRFAREPEVDLRAQFFSSKHIKWKNLLDMEVPLCAWYRSKHFKSVVRDEYGRIHAKNVRIAFSDPWHLQSTTTQWKIDSGYKSR